MYYFKWNTHNTTSLNLDLVYVLIKFMLGCKMQELI